MPQPLRHFRLRAGLPSVCSAQCQMERTRKTVPGFLAANSAATAANGVVRSALGRDGSAAAELPPRRFIRPQRFPPAGHLSGGTGHGPRDVDERHGERYGRAGNSDTAGADANRAFIPESAGDRGQLTASARQPRARVGSQVSPGGAAACSDANYHGTRRADPHPMERSTSETPLLRP